jgi:hypothetical protein
MEALASAGVNARLAAWDDPVVDWRDARLTVIRSTWDYHHHREAFVRWAVRTAGETQLWNPAPVARWNAHKGYLLDLAAAGVPAVPTVLVPRAQSTGLAAVMSERRWDRVVVKPAVSASSYRTLTVENGNRDEGEAHSRILRERDALVSHTSLPWTITVSVP